jgi:hypothetical protein
MEPFPRRLTAFGLARVIISLFVYSRAEGAILKALFLLFIFQPFNFGFVFFAEIVQTFIDLLRTWS